MFLRKWFLSFRVRAYFVHRGTIFVPMLHLILKSVRWMGESDLFWVSHSFLNEILGLCELLRKPTNYSNDRHKVEKCSPSPFQWHMSRVCNGEQNLVFVEMLIRELRVQFHFQADGGFYSKQILVHTGKTRKFRKSRKLQSVNLSTLIPKTEPKRLGYCQFFEQPLLTRVGCHWKGEGERFFTTCLSWSYFFGLSLLSDSPKFTEDP